MTTTSKALYRASFDAIDKILENNGGTFDAQTLRPVDLPGGYMVSRQDSEQVFDMRGLNYADRARMLDSAAQSMRILSIMLALKPGQYIGAWIDNDILYIDVSDCIDDEQQARNTGKANKQLAIYDIENQISIYL